MRRSLTRSLRVDVASGGFLSSISSLDDDDDDDDDDSFGQKSWQDDSFGQKCWQDLARMDLSFKIMEKPAEIATTANTMMSMISQLSLNDLPDAEDSCPTRRLSSMDEVFHDSLTISAHTSSSNKTDSAPVIACRMPSRSSFVSTPEEKRDSRATTSRSLLQRQVEASSMHNAQWSSQDCNDADEPYIPQATMASKIRSKKNLL